MNSREELDAWLLSEVRWVDQVLSPKVPWDERKPAGRLIAELFDLGSREHTPLPEPHDEAQAYMIGKLVESRTVIDAILREAAARVDLHEQTITEMDYQISRAALSLDELAGGVGYNTGVDMRRTHLERELSNLRRERRSALLKTWQDVSQVRKDFRHALAEYRSLRDRLKLM